MFRSWPQLAEEIAHAVRADSAVIDGEICCLDPDGRSNFENLLFRREWPYFYAFDLLPVNGRDLRHLPLRERKRQLVAVLPKIECRILYLDHLVERGMDLYELACSRDLEGIVGKWAPGTYASDGRTTSWLKVNSELLADAWPPRAVRGAARPPPAATRAACAGATAGSTILPKRSGAPACGPFRPVATPKGVPPPSYQPPAPPIST